MKLRPLILAAIVAALPIAARAQVSPNSVLLSSFSGATGTYLPGDAQLTAACAAAVGKTLVFDTTVTVSQTLDCSALGYAPQFVAGGEIITTPWKGVNPTITLQTPIAPSSQTLFDTTAGGAVTLTNSSTAITWPNWFKGVSGSPTIGGTPIPAGVTGPGSSTNNNLASFNGTTGTAIKDSGVPSSNFPVSGTVAGDIATYNNTTGKLQDGGLLLSSIPSGRGATLHQTPANPTATASATPVMMGLGATCHITPSFSGRVDMSIEALINSSIVGGSWTVHLRYGTGTAPINGAAQTGNQATAVFSGGNAASSGVFQYPFTLRAVITGLVPGTAYWIDLAAAEISGGGNAAIVNPDCDAIEE